MKINVKRTPEQLELVKAMASKDLDTRMKAQAAVATFMGPVVNRVINQARTLGNLFATETFEEDDNPSLPLDLYYDITDVDYINVWSNTMAGGLPTNLVAPTQSELKFDMYPLESAWSFMKKHADRSRLGVVGATFTRMAQEILIKREKMAAKLMLTALANASTSINGTATQHVFKTATANTFAPSDLNNLFTRAKRLGSSWYGGTPDSFSGRGLTDIFVGPEIMGQIRGMAYNPIVEGASTSATTRITLTDSQREALWNGGDVSNFYGLNVIEINELGDGFRWTALFDSIADAASITFKEYDGTNDGAFATTDDLVIGLDSTKRSLVRAAFVGSETGEEVNVQVDDQFAARQKQIGWYTELEEGMVVVDDRALLGLVV